jgi:hypothetical protein
VPDPRAKVLDFEASVGTDGRLTARGESFRPPESWAAEHLVLAGLVRCSLTSLGYHTRREGIEVTGSGDAEAAARRRVDSATYVWNVA